MPTARQPTWLQYGAGFSHPAHSLPDPRGPTRDRPAHRARPARRRRPHPRHRRRRRHRVLPDRSGTQPGRPARRPVGDRRARAVAARPPQSVVPALGLPAGDHHHHPGHRLHRRARRRVAHPARPDRARDVPRGSPPASPPSWPSCSPRRCRWCFGELVPKNVAIADPLRTARAVVWLQAGFARALRLPDRRPQRRRERRRPAPSASNLPRSCARRARPSELGALVRASGARGTLDAAHRHPHGPVAALHRPGRRATS